MRILIISRSYYPLISPRSFRTTELAHQLAKDGHDITLMLPMADEERLQFAKKHGVKLISYGEVRYGDIDLKKGGRLTVLFKRGVRRLANLLFEYPDIQIMFLVSKSLRNHTQEYDLLISIAVPHPIHWGVAWSRTGNHKVGRTWVADCGDPFMGVTIDTFKKAFYFKYLEMMFCKKADYIAVPIEEAKKAYYAEYRSKIIVIPQGFDFSITDTLKNLYKTNNVPTFIYAGSFIPGARDPKKLLAFLAELKFDFKFIIFTRNAILIKPWLEKLGGKLEVHSFVPREEVLLEMSKADFLLNINNNTQVQSPSKLIDYYLAGRPVLSIYGNDDMADKILPFLKGDYTQSYRFEHMERYNIKQVAEQFYALG